MSTTSSRLRVADLETSLADVEKRLEAVAYSHRRLLAPKRGEAAAASAAAALGALDKLSACATTLNASSSTTSQAAEALANEHAGLRAAVAAQYEAAGSRTLLGGASGGAITAAEVLELPSLMDGCVRKALTALGSSSSTAVVAGSSASGLAAAVPEEDALDLLDVVAQVCPPSLVSVSTSASSVPHTDLLSSVAARTRASASELIDGVAVAVAHKAPLPLVLRASSTAKRLRAHQTRARARSAAALAGGGSGGGGVGATSSSSAAAREAADALGVRHTFAATRAAQFWREVEGVSRSAAGVAGAGRPHVGGGGASSSASAAISALVAHQLPRAMDIHRATLTDAVNHSSAVAAALTAAGNRQPHIEAAGKAALAGLFADLASWQAARLAADIGSLEDASAIGPLHQQLAYAARRCGRVGVAWDRPLAVMLRARAVESVAAAFTVARRKFAAVLWEVCHAGASSSEAGMRSQLSSTWSELTNSTSSAVNAARSCWHAGMAVQVGKALRLHVDEVVADAERCLADCFSPAVLDACMTHVDGFVTAVLGIAEV